MELIASYAVLTEYLITCFHASPKWSALGLTNGEIHVLDANGTCSRIIEDQDKAVWAITTRENQLLSGGGDGHLRLYDLTTGACHFALPGHTNTIRSIVFTSADIAVTGSRDGSVRIWDLQNSLCLRVLEGHERTVRVLEVKDDLIVSASDEGIGRIWSLSGGECLHVLQGHSGAIFALVILLNLAVTGGFDKVIRVWNTTDGSLVSILEGHTGVVNNLKVRQDILISGSTDGSVRGWSLISYQQLWQVQRHEHTVLSFDLQDEMIVAAGNDSVGPQHGCGLDSKVRTWQLGEENTNPEEHKCIGYPWQMIARVCCTGDRFAVAGIKRGKVTVELWSVVTSQSNATESK